MPIARLQAAHIQQVGDQPVKPLQGVLRGGYQFGAFLVAPVGAGVGEAIDGGPGRCPWGAQVVADRRQ